MLEDLVFLWKSNIYPVDSKFSLVVSRINSAFSTSEATIYSNRYVLTLMIMYLMPMKGNSLFETIFPFPMQQD